MVTLPEAVVAKELVKVGDDLVEQPEAFHTLVVEVELHVELVEVGDAGEEHAHAGVGVAVEFLHTTHCSALLH